MLQTTQGGSDVVATGATPPAPAPSEIVHRPEPGLARGKWEASPAFFWIVLGVGLLALLGVTLVRMRAKRANSTPGLEESPRS